MTVDTLSPDDRAAEVRLLALLDRLRIGHALHRHAPIFTVEESVAETAHLPGAHTKNLFLKAKDGALLLATCFGHRRIRVADLEKSVGAKRLSFGSSELLGEVLGVRPGSVTPLALMNDRARRVRLILDAQMMEMETLNFHPLHNAATVALSRTGFLAFLGETGHMPQEADFDALEALAAERAREKTG
ncbi:MAG: prolyl-tRNA synthetase associated domain-containing protein [Pikeienuella sp.]|uniref:prolyl-tRNA synthetase associated domain-containing protein n=1 Tax=Pikeienuella sp. TaxID=2831957 RepID=UPI00391960DC